MLAGAEVPPPDASFSDFAFRLFFQARAARNVVELLIGDFFRIRAAKAREQRFGLALLKFDARALGNPRDLVCVLGIQRLLVDLFRDLRHRLLL